MKKITIHWQITARSDSKIMKNLQWLRLRATLMGMCDQMINKSTSKISNISIVQQAIQNENSNTHSQLHTHTHDLHCIHSHDWYRAKRMCAYSRENKWKEERQTHTQEERNDQIHILLCICIWWVSHIHRWKWKWKRNNSTANRNKYVHVSIKLKERRDRHMCEQSIAQTMPDIYIFIIYENTHRHKYTRIDAHEWAHPPAQRWHCM